MSPPFLPAAPGWERPLNQYLEFLHQHKGVQNRSLGSWLRRFTRQVAVEAPVPASLTLARVDAWVLQLLQDDLSARTVRGYVGAVRSFLSWLYDERRVPSNLATFMEGPLTWRDVTVPQHFAWDEVQKLIVRVDVGSASGLQDRAMLLLFANCGLRPGEQVRLELSDVDLERQTVRIRQRKSGDWLVMPVWAATVDALRRHLHLRTHGMAERVFLTPNGCPYRTGSQVSERIRRLADEAGLGRHRGAQALRRAVGTRLVEKGATLPQVALMLGHDGLASIRHYVRVSMAMLAEVADNYAEVL